MSKEIPSFTICSKCGSKKFARNEIIKTRLEKFNYLEECNSNWICRACRRSEKTLNKLDEILNEPTLIKEEDEDFFAK